MLLLEGVMTGVVIGCMVKGGADIGIVVIDVVIECVDRVC